MKNIRVIDTNSFIFKANIIHNYTYKYDKVNYVNKTHKITVTCPIHGDWIVSPVLHLKGHMCPKCSKEKERKTNSEFINECKAKFGNTLDYSKTKYLTARTNVIITCKKHGDFTVMPKNFLRGKGCPKCVVEKESKIRKKKSFKKFIKNVKNKYGNRYIILKKTYDGKNKNVSIICKIHGAFKQKPDNFLRGKGCPKCVVEELKIKLRKGTDKFIKEALVKHKSLYKYDKVKYISANDNVIITCKKHGDFIQTPSAHLKGHGCPICKTSKGEDKIRIFLINHNIKFIREYKIPGYNYRYDFYLPQLNILIEYDGAQHFKPVKHFGGENGFNLTKQRDIEKNKLAKLHKHILIRIPYTKFKTLEEYLLKSISNYYKYYKDGIFYKNFYTFCKENKCNKKTKAIDIKNYLTINII